MPIPPLPMDVSWFDGDVTITIPPALARDIAAVWGAAHAADPLLSETRPRWHDDVISIVAAAALADQQAGVGPEPVYARRLATVNVLEATS